MKRSVRLLMLFAWFIVYTVPIYAEVPELIGYQGRLVEGESLVNGHVAIVFRLFDAVEEGNELYAEEQVVMVVDGLYNTFIGLAPPEAGALGQALTNSNVYLDVMIEGVPLEPRQRIGSSCFAMKSADAETLNGMNAEAFAPNPHGHVFSQIEGVVSDEQVPDDITVNNAANADTVDGQHASSFISTANDYGRLGVASVLYEGSQTLQSLYIDAWGPDKIRGNEAGAIFVVENSGTGDGIACRVARVGVDSVVRGTGGKGVSGVAEGDYGYGLYGVAEGYYGNGVYGEAQGNNGTAVEGRATATGDLENKGGYFWAQGNRGIGIYGTATYLGSVTNYGGYFLSGGAYGMGVYGLAAGDLGIGVVGESVEGKGVEGRTQSSNQWVPAIYGRNEGSGDGVYGWSQSRHGTVGVSYSPNALHAGVWAKNNGVGPGVYAEAGTGGKAMILKGNLEVRSAATGATVAELGEGLDFAEGFNVTDRSSVTPGSVLVIDPVHPGQLAMSRVPYDRKVAGVVAGANGLGSGVRLGTDGFDHDVALAGRVYCNVDATSRGVQPGDLLTTGATPGFAMAVSDYRQAQGAVLGKAMEPLDQGRKGQILILVTLQ